MLDSWRISFVVSIGHGVALLAEALGFAVCSSVVLGLFLRAVRVDRGQIRET